MLRDPHVLYETYLASWLSLRMAKTPGLPSDEGYGGERGGIVSSTPGALGLQQISQMPEGAQGLNKNGVGWSNCG